MITLGSTMEGPLLATVVTVLPLVIAIVMLGVKYGQLVTRVESVDRRLDKAERRIHHMIRVLYRVAPDHMSTDDGGE